MLRTDYAVAVVVIITIGLAGITSAGLSAAVPADYGTNRSQFIAANWSHAPNVSYMNWTSIAAAEYNGSIYVTDGTNVDAICCADSSTNTPTSWETPTPTPEENPISSIILWTICIAPPLLIMYFIRRTVYSSDDYVPHYTPPTPAAPTAPEPSFQHTDQDWTEVYAGSTAAPDTTTLEEVPEKKVRKYDLDK